MLVGGRLTFMHDLNLFFPLSGRAAGQVLPWVGQYLLPGYVGHESRCKTSRVEHFPPEIDFPR